MKIQELIDINLMNANAKRANRVGSGKWKPSLFGACYRRQYWAKSNEPESDPTDERGLRVFEAGRLFHDFVQQFFPNSQKEVKIETPEVKGFADIVTECEVVDIKSVHSDAFWYLKRNVLCTLDDGKEVRVEEGAISGDKVKYNKKERTIVSRCVLSILEEKINNWLQVGWYAIQLGKPFARLVFVSKDDLCIAEYCISVDKLKPLVDNEITSLYNIKTTPEPQPRLYGGKECDWCNYKTKCKGRTND